MSEECSKRLKGIFYGMKSRCFNPKNPNFIRYGARGISICDEWVSDPRLFYSWSISSGYGEGLSIDRIDNNKGYSPENCRWVDRKTQQRNKRNTKFVDIGGVRVSLSGLCEALGLDQHIISERISRGASFQQAISGPRTPKYQKGKERPGSKLSEDDVRFIRSNCGKMTLKQLSEKFGVVTSVIHRVQTGTKWKHVA